MRADKRETVRAARTAVTAVASLLLARLLRLPEAYWAAITSMIVMQSTLGSACTVSKQRLAGTAVDAVLGALLVTYAGASWEVFAAGVFGAGLISAALAGCCKTDDFRDEDGVQGKVAGEQGAV